MKKTFKALKFPIVFILFLLSFIACDRDFSTVESSVLGTDNANFTTSEMVLPIVAYNKKLDAVQINNLPSNLLGIFKDPEYGKTTASIDTQITPTTFNKDFGKAPAVDSVVINIPYFSTIIGVDDDGNPEYQLDSLYGNAKAEYKLTVYQSNYFLLSFDPTSNDNVAQNYFSRAEDNQDPTANYAFGANTQLINFDDHIGEVVVDTTFTPSAKAIVLTTGEGDDETETRSVPAFRYSTNRNSNNGPEELKFWQQAILDRNGEDIFSNANNFRKHFKGLYFKVEETTDDGSMVLLNFNSNNALITIHYSINDGDDDNDGIPNYADIDFIGDNDADNDGINDDWDVDITKGTDADDDGIDDKTPNPDTFSMNFSGNRLNTFINGFSTPQNGDKDNGDKTLYLKGLEGSMAVVDLFPTEQEREAFRDEFIDKDTGKLKKLINEAHLVIYEDENKVTNTVDENGDEYHKYDRIYAYDVKNNIPTIDYQVDPVESNIALNSKVISLGQRNEDGKFKIRLTEHLNNIIQNDSTNTKIGLVLSNNVNVISSSEILNSNDDVTAVPTASVISPRGTIIHGTNTDSSRKLQLKLFITEPKGN
jgi:hypothetical protein